MYYVLCRVKDDHSWGSVSGEGENEDRTPSIRPVLLFFLLVSLASAEHCTLAVSPSHILVPIFPFSHPAWDLSDMPS